MKYRSQLGPFDAMSLETAIDCSTDDAFAARQEFGQEADINFLMRRSGVPFTGQPIRYGEVDMDLNLQAAYTVTQEAREAFRRLDPKVQEKFGSWEALYLASLEETADVLRKEVKPDRTAEPDPVQPA